MSSEHATPESLETTVVDDPTFEPPPAPPADAPSGASTIDLAKLTWGLVLVGLGGLLLLERLDLILWERIWRYWPLLLVGIGGVQVVLASSRGGRRVGLWLIGIGAWLLINFLEVFDLFFDTSWPLLLVIAGAIGLAVPRRPGRWGLPLVVLLVGIWLFLNVQHAFGLYLDTSWPLILIALGGLLIFRGLTERRRPSG